MNGNIQMIKANIFTIDKITSDITTYVQKSLDNANTSRVKLSLGSLTGLNFLAGTGPQIPIKISTSGKISTDLRSEFISQGINQTMHRIYLQIDCGVNILTPFKTIGENITNQILLAENLIIGQIPSTYYNLEGIEQPQDTLNAIQ